jgi:hypothetical protein
MVSRLSARGWSCPEIVANNNKMQLAVSKVLIDFRPKM